MNYVVPKVPSSVKLLYIDSDPIAYHGACGVEKTTYNFVNKLSGDETQMFPDARTAKHWLKDQCEVAEILGTSFDPDEWERMSHKEVRSEGEAIKATKSTLNSWLKYAKGIPFKGYLTERGVTKTKDVEGLEDRYQGKRGTIVPVHLEACRDYLLSCPEFHLLKGGFEADAACISGAEKRGKKGMLLSIDKDLRQAEGTYCMDMTYLKTKTKAPMIFYSGDDGVGEIWHCPIKSKPKLKKLTGVGFKFLCYQAMAGDTSDGYYGLKGVGQETVLNLLADCRTHKECLDAMYRFYEARGDVTYQSWDGQTVTKTPLELMHQHLWLAYQERSPSDEFSFDKYDWTI